MTNSFNDALTAPKDRVRVMLGDTATPWKFSDETINYFLTQNTSEREVAALLADSLAAQYAGRPALKIGDFSVDYAEQSKHFRDLADQLRTSAGASAAGYSLGSPDMGGVSRLQMETVESNDDRVASLERINSDGYGRSRDSDGRLL